MSIESCNHELGRLLKTQQGLVGMQAKVILESRVNRPQHMNIRPGRKEALAFAAQDQYRDLRVEPRLQDALIKGPHHLIGIGIGRGIIEFEDGNAMLNAVVNQRCTHQNPFEQPRHSGRGGKTGGYCVAAILGHWAYP